MGWLLCAGWKSAAIQKDRSDLKIENAALFGASEFIEAL